MLPTRAELFDHCFNSQEDISEKCCLDIVRVLGGLSPWWLEPTIIQRAADGQPAYQRWLDTPTLPQTPGGCWALLCKKKPSSVFKDAFLLPLQWRAATSHGPGLPPSIVHLADRVLGQVQQEGRATEGRWGLHFCDGLGLDELDLRELDGQFLSADSAWSALYGGLVLALDDCSADPAVWTTAAWHDQFGIGPVDGIDAKVKLAAAGGAQKLFLPAENQRKALEIVQSHGLQLDCHPLLPVAKDPRPGSLLQPYLEVLGVPPGVDEPFSRRCAHYGRVGKPIADQYLFTTLWPDIPRRCRQRFLDDNPTVAISHLITIVGTSPGAVALAPAAVGAKCCLLLHDGSPKMEEHSRLIQQRLKERPWGVDCVCRAFDSGSRKQELSSIGKLVDEFTAGVAEDRIGFDLTPGFKSLTLALREMASAGSFLLYCRHKQLAPDYRPEPGSECLECWQPQFSHPTG